MEIVKELSPEERKEKIKSLNEDMNIFKHKAQTREGELIELIRLSKSDASDEYKDKYNSLTRETYESLVNGKLDQWLDLRDKAVTAFRELTHLIGEETDLKEEEE